MPGHVKLGKAGEPDLDPMPYLVCDMETKRKDQNKPYDPKKSVWAPDGKGGYVEALLQSDEGGKATVMVGHEVKKSVKIVNPDSPINLSESRLFRTILTPLIFHLSVSIGPKELY